MQDIPQVVVGVDWIHPLAKFFNDLAFAGAIFGNPVIQNAIMTKSFNKQLSRFEAVMNKNMYAEKFYDAIHGENTTLMSMFHLRYNAIC